MAESMPENPMIEDLQNCFRKYGIFLTSMDMSVESDVEDIFVLGQKGPIKKVVVGRRTYLTLSAEIIESETSDETRAGLANLQSNFFRKQAKDMVAQGQSKRKFNFKD